MAEKTNPRKVGRTADMYYISLPVNWMREHGIEHGDQFQLVATENGFKALRTEWQVAGDE